MKKGRVWIAGAGPGEAGLLTLRAKDLMQEADVIVYDALIGREVLCCIPDGKELIYVGKRAGKHLLAQAEINGILLREAEKGKKVLRLKGGDPFIFGRGGEEAQFLHMHGIPFEIVPGITSAVSVPAYAGIPVTHRDFASSVHIITGHTRKDGGEQTDYPSLVKAGGTLVFLMGVTELPRICGGLLEAGMDPQTPAAVIEKGTTPRQREIRSTLLGLPEDAVCGEVRAPAVIVIGEAAGMAEELSWSGERPLGGRAFLLTRPEERMTGLSGALRRLGAQVIEFPVIRICPLAPDARLKRLCVRGGKERWLVFTSPSGVELFFESLFGLGLDLRDVLGSAGKIKTAAIGSATAQELKKHGLLADVVPEEFCAAALGLAISKKAANGSEIFLLRAKEGSKELLPPLLQAGLSVEDIPVYETRYQKNAWAADMVAAMVKEKELDGIVFMSGSAVRGFAAAFPGLSLSGIKAVCIGSRTAREAERRGMETVVAKEASTDSLIEKIQEEYGGRTD